MYSRIDADEIEVAKETMNSGHDAGDVLSFIEKPETLGKLPFVSDIAKVAKHQLTVRLPTTSNA